MVSEVTYKLKVDIIKGVLVNLTDSLKLPKVIKDGINHKEALKFITPAPLHVEVNINSKSSPVRMVIVPHRPHMTTK